MHCADGGKRRAERRMLVPTAFLRRCCPFFFFFVDALQIAGVVGTGVLGAVCVLYVPVEKDRVFRWGSRAVWRCYGATGVLCGR